MQLEQQFTIPTDVATAWDLMVDVERIAPCFPGAKVLSADGDSVEGQVRVKLGPIVLTYAGVLKFLERDEASHRLTMDGHGVDAKGNGSASARVTAHLTPESEGSTLCTLVTDLNITGRPAQFGRGMMLEIGNNILGKFSSNLAAMLTSDAPTADQEQPSSPAPLSPSSQLSAEPGGAVASADNTFKPATTTERAGSHRQNSSAAAAAPEAEPLDLLRAAGGATLKRTVPVIAVLAVIVGAIVWVSVK